jgi:hypothetical protein
MWVTQRLVLCCYVRAALWRWFVPQFLQERFMTERFAQIRYDELPAEVRPLADDILKVSSAALGGPYNALLRSPDMARRAFDFLDYLRFKTSVNKRLNELAILIQARISNAQCATCSNAVGPAACKRTNAWCMTFAFSSRSTTACPMLYGKKPWPAWASKRWWT